MFEFDVSPVTSKRSRALVAASAIYTACRLSACGRTAEEICAQCEDPVDRQSLLRVQAELCRGLSLSAGVVPPEQVVARIGSRSKHDFAAKCTDYGRRLGACK